MKSFLIHMVAISIIAIGGAWLSSCRTPQRANEKFYAKNFLQKAAATTMKVHFETPTENATITSYVIARSTTGKYWYTVKTITANKRPSVYDVSIPYSYGYFRIRINKTKGYVFSKNLYVNK